MIGKTFSHYKILAKLGEGGMGVVYCAKDTRLKRTVALKFLPPQLTADPEAKERFIQEAQAASSLDHTNICTIHEINESEDGRLYIVMPCYEGQTLKDKLTDGALSVEIALDITEQIAKGLAKAHAKGIVHRDIKPANIFITSDGVVKILDFGIAKLAGQTLHTKTGSTLGTVAYMSPEQAQGLPVDHRTDIWSLGVLLYEMLSGRRPFCAEYDQAKLYAIINVEPEPLEKFAPKLTSELSEIVSRALQKQTIDRYASMTDFVTALQTMNSNASDKQRHISFQKQAKHNLPLQLTSFIGRDKEIKEVKRLLQENRLVTLTGAGGCGKTRLAIKIADDLAHEYPDGIWLVELASIADPKLVVHSIADALQIKEEPNMALQQTIGKRLQDKQLLLLIDNCEHLIAICSEIIETLMKAVPTLAVLATSRESLNIPGEMVWKVPSLSVPDIFKLPEVNELLDFEAIRLFVERVKICLPSFMLSDENAECVAKICFRLDGIPLAIELAAARIKLFSPAEILDRLYDCFHLLTGGSRTALERQKTLQATVDWSYALLAETEKMLFNRLSVFVGGCDMQAIETVCESEPIDRKQIIELVSSLIDKSLIVTYSDKKGGSRYRLLETIRLYAGGKLFETGEATLFRDRHFQYYLELAEQSYKYHFNREVQWADRLEIDHENFIAAIEWTKDEPKQQLLLTGALAWFWYAHSRYQLGIDYLQSAIANYSIRDAALARALYGFGMIHNYLCHFSVATPLLQSSLEIWRELDQQKEIGLLLYELGFPIVMSTDNHDRYKAYYEESANLFNKIGEHELALRSESMLAYAHICALDAAQAEPLIEKLLNEALAYNMQWWATLLRHMYADCPLINKDYIASEKRYAAALLAALNQSDIRQASAELHGMAMSVAGQKRYLKAVRLDGAALQKSREICIDFFIFKFWTILYEKTMIPAIAILGDKATKIAEEEGRQMGFEKACEYALDFAQD